LLGFLVSHRGIEANPEKIKAIEAMRPPARIKDVQKLAGSLAALSRFILRLAERALPFFKLLRKFSPFSWTKEAERAFQEVKQHLVSLPILVAPEPGEPLYLYIAAASEAVSMVLVAERAAQQPQGSQQVPPGEGCGPTTMMLTEGQVVEDPGPTTGVQTIQKSAYYVSEVLHEAKARYLETHKLIYAILVASRK
jgi:ribonuclease HI